MLFNSVEYALFLPAVCALYWLAPVRWRVDVLLVASYIFYASWSAGYAAMLFGLAVANYLFGLALGRAQKHRLALVAACVAFDIAVLGFFKYGNFGLSTVQRVAQSLGISWDPALMQVVLPLGISFFTFEFIHYLVDIYRGDIPVHDFSKFHVFAAFFPTQISGPIKRFQQFVPSLDRIGHFNPDLARDGLRLIAIGLGKKLLLADKLAPVANTGFAAAGQLRLGTVEAWVTALAFSLQIYFDFSGYTDIARGSAQLLGFTIPRNFDAPYLATSISEFWHRWHISLSTWLRDYIFIPLGGSRRGLARTLANLMLTFLIGGLWHGGAWHFVLWGAWWGAALCIARLVPRSHQTGWPRVAISLAGWLVTQLVALLGWTIFRASSIANAAMLVGSMMSWARPTGTIRPSVEQNVVVLALVYLLWAGAARRSWLPSLPSALRPLAAGLGIAAASAYLVSDVTPLGQRFIYFQF